MSTPAEPQSDRMDKVAALTTSLSNAVLHAHMMGREPNNEQIHALAKAARLFHERGEPWPPILEQVLQELTSSMNGEGSDEATAGQDDTAAGSEPASDERGVRRFLNALKRKKN